MLKSNPKRIKVRFGEERVEQTPRDSFYETVDGSKKMFHPHKQLARQITEKEFNRLEKKHKRINLPNTFMGGKAWKYKLKPE